MNQATLPETEELTVANVIQVYCTLIRPFANQPRKYFDPTELQNLADSIAEFGQQEAGWVKELIGKDAAMHKYELVDGERRWQALQLAGISTMKVIVIDVENEEHQFLLSVIGNFGGAEHGPLEIAQAIARFKKNGRSTDNIRKIFGKSVGWVYQYLKIAEQLHPSVQDMMSQKIPEDERLTFSTALVVADVPQELQEEIARVIVSQKLKLIQAKDYVHREGVRVGFVTKSPGRTPSNDYAVVRNFINRVQRETGVFGKKPDNFFKDMFAHREDADHEQILLDLEENIKALKVLVTRIRSAKKK